MTTDFNKPPRRTPGCCIRGGCHCGLSCCTCKTHCGRDYCNKKSKHEIDQRNNRIAELPDEINKLRRELSGLKREAKVQ